MDLLNIEASVWDHYRDYLIEATGRIPNLTPMRNQVRNSCSRAQLTKLMVKEFDPFTVMQGLEQWLCMMELLLYTGLRKYGGMSRMDAPGIGNEGLLDDLKNTLQDSFKPDAHLYYMSAATQDTIFLATELRPKEAPFLIQKYMKEAHLDHNWELMMHLGDAYSAIGDYDNAYRWYYKLQEESSNVDRSIQDAIDSTRFMESMGFSPLGSAKKQRKPAGTVLYQGDTPFRRESPKVGRNDPCPCGSGKKYKNCCGKFI